MSDSRSKFQQLLRELFQFDCADLDFGIYRIMNFKRDVIERFITHDLPQVITEQLSRGALAEQTRAAEELAQIAQQIRADLPADALDPEGRLADAYHGFPLGMRYLECQAEAAGARTQQATEATIYNHLYAFFSRYYLDGDFVSKRRYSKRERYAIPYNGEEVYLYWANQDQYYIKTAEYFTDYSFKAPNGVTVDFKLVAAEVEQDNVKGEKRFFLPRLSEIGWDQDAVQLYIPFEYRPLSAQEAITYAQRNQQEAILAQAVAEIPRRVAKEPRALAALQAERRRDSQDNPVSYLQHHLRQYTRRNTADFFIHKDLTGFLSRELDFYLKNEVLNVDEMEAAGEGLAEGWFQVLRLIKAVGDRIIEFLAQIEDFQKMLWEKRKFITETFYCIALGQIDKAFYPAIAACQVQWDEWRALLHIDAEQPNLFTSDKGKKDRRLAFLKSHPTLVLDTRHTAPDFVDRLLASFDDLDEITDGLLVHSENWQALNLLAEKYDERIERIHIDPPYNTQTSGFLYKNDYQHSSWLAMMRDRVTAGLPLLSRDGAFLCHIDENEYELLHLMFTNVGIPDGGTIVWDKKNPMLGRKGIATQHEYVLWRTWNDCPVYLRPTNIRMLLDKVDSLVREHGGVNDQVRREFSQWINTCDALTGGERAYRFIEDDGRVYQSVAMGAPEPRTDPKFHTPLIHPLTKAPCPVPSNGWSRAPETLQQLIAHNEIIFGEDEAVQPRRKVYLTGTSGRQVSSVIKDSGRGKNDVEKLGLEFPYCHPVSLYEELLGAGLPQSARVVLDHFAGSGTSGHAVINLSREDGVRRRFILVEVADYFDTVLLPRLKKVTFSPEWKEGKPKRPPTAEEVERGPRIMKVIRLESYEDALNNIAFDDSSGQQAMELDDYLLKYMLHWETRRSETLLNVDGVACPFAYQLHLRRDGETRAQAVDLPETFNYLLGLHVQTRRACDDKGRRYLAYRGRVDGRGVAVIWRETEGWEQGDYERDKQFVAEHGLAEGADDVYVNGDSFIPGARALEGLFKARMFAPVEV